MMKEETRTYTLECSFACENRVGFGQQGLKQQLWSPFQHHPRSSTPTGA